jgi:hypothetical protein
MKFSEVGYEKDENYGVDPRRFDRTAGFIRMR